MRMPETILDYIVETLQTPILLPKGGILGLNIRRYLVSKVALVDLFSWIVAGVVRRYIKERLLGE